MLEEVHTTRTKKPKIWLTDRQVNAILKTARQRRERDFMIFQLCRYGLRVGEVVGRNRLPGIHLEDLRFSEGGVSILGKGTTEVFYPLPRKVMGQLRRYVSQNGFGQDRRIFPISECRVEQLVKSYSRKAGIADYRLVSPHRLRAFFATDSKNRGLNAFVIRDLMRHVSIKTTNTYVGRSTPEQVSDYMEFLAKRSRT
jgi:integrase